MRSYGKRFILIAGVGLLAACGEGLAPTDAGTLLELSGKPSPPAALYTYTFTGDIQGTLQNVPANAGDPFKQVSAGGLTFWFPAVASGDTGACDSEQPELMPTTIDWRGYATFPWGGDLDMSRRKRGAFHLQITGSQSDGAGSINLVVNDVAAEGTDGGGNPILQFDDARALISAFSYSNTEGVGGPPIYDPQDRCVDFEITATPQ